MSEKRSPKKSASTDNATFSELLEGLFGEGEGEGEGRRGRGKRALREVPVNQDARLLPLIPTTEVLLSGSELGVAAEELKGFNLEPLKMYQLVFAFWQRGEHPRPSLRTLLSVALKVTVKVLRLSERGVKLKLLEVERVTLKKSRRQGEALYAEVESRPLKVSFEELRGVEVIQEELMERLKTDLNRLQSSELEPWRKLVESHEQLSLEQWAELAFYLSSPEPSFFVQWVLLDTLLDRYHMLGDVLSVSVFEKAYFTHLRHEAKQRFTMHRRRLALKERIHGMMRLVKELERQERMQRFKRHAKLSLVDEPEEGGAQGDSLDKEPPRGSNLANKSTEELERVLERIKEEQRATQALLANARDEDDEDDEHDDPIERLGAQLKSLELTPEVRAEVKRTYRRLRSGPPMGPEHHILKSLLEVVAELPWERRSEQRRCDLNAVRRALDEAHEGLDEVKERILEHLAVRELSGEPQGTVLCLSGPPGVGKTTLVKQIAQALGRPFVRVSLGGVEDEAAIRGHRRTYVGALPGRLCDALRQAKVKDPVILLDELDKLGQSKRGNPEAALLEVLDPEQNAQFRDHYLEMPLDLSEVLFISTVNQPRALSAPLHDRLEMVELKGYTLKEKLKIAHEHLLPKLLKRHGLSEGAISFQEGALEVVIERYTKESGVRQLERSLGKLCRKLALKTLTSREAQGGEQGSEQGSEQGKKSKKKASKEPTTKLKWSLDTPRLIELLGAPKYRAEKAQPIIEPGLAHGLAWTALGGTTLHIETARYPGKGQLKLTGQLGEVMRESAQTALTALRVRHGEQLKAAHDFEAQDLHIHLPEGATPKDGPSAGVTLYCALYSLMMGQPLRADVAMSGECTLQGRVIAVGGLQEKLLAAQRDGMKRVILSAENREEVLSFPDEVRGELELVWVERAEEALKSALHDPSVLTLS